MADELRARLESLWAEVRRALADYDVPRMKRLLHAPENMPAPPRPQAAAFLKALPDLAASRFLKIVQEKDRAGYVARTHLDQEGTTLSILRFRRKGADWELVPAPETLSSYQTDVAFDAAGLAAEVDGQPALKLFPAGEMLGEPPPPDVEPPDERPEADIRKELEGIWKRIRDAFAAGKPEGVEDLLLYAEGVESPTSAEAKDAAKELPDLARGRFIRLAWHPDKPRLVGYYAEIKPGNAKITTVALLVFVRKDGAYRFAPGPGALTVVELPPTSQAKLKALCAGDPRLKL